LSRGFLLFQSTDPHSLPPHSVLSANRKSMQSHDVRGDAPFWSLIGTWGSYGPDLSRPAQSPFQLRLGIREVAAPIRVSLLLCSAGSTNAVRTESASGHGARRVGDEVRALNRPERTKVRRSGYDESVTGRRTRWTGPQKSQSRTTRRSPERRDRSRQRTRQRVPGTTRQAPGTTRQVPGTTTAEQRA
jgi:hypothetical protein